jgi:hypothetical protein
MRPWIEMARQRPSGELMPMSMVKLRLLDQPDLELLPPDPKRTEKTMPLAKKGRLGGHRREKRTGKPSSC